MGKLVTANRTALVAFSLFATLLVVTPAERAAAQEEPTFEPGGVFLTGHDPDFHARLGPNAAGARRIIQAGVDYVTGNKPQPSMLLVTSVISGGRGHSDPREGIAAAGFDFDVADDGAAGGNVLDVSTVDLDTYDVIVIASDFGGWLRQSELDALIARSAEIIDYINGGGGFVALAASGGGNGLTQRDRYGYLPFIVSETPLNRAENGNTVTELGAAMGLTDADVNGNFSHNVFTESGGLEPVDIDPFGNVLTLATKKQIGDGGVIDEPPAPPFLPPTADAGPDQTVVEGSVVRLDATNSTSSGLVVDTYTTTDDFLGGEGVNVTEADDRLRLDDTQEAFDFIWIAASGRGTVVKIDTVTGEVLGEYWSAPQNRSKNPSRTTVDKDGNVWVGNRDESTAVNGLRGSVAKIGLAENGQCVDRNGNGVIDTSSGLADILPWPNSAGEDTAGGVSTAADECIIEYVRTSGRNIRHVSVDAENHVWVGGDGFGGTPRFLDRITPDGEIVRSINMASGADTGAGSVPCCYGGLVDSNGYIWTASAGSNQLVRVDPSKPNGDSGLVLSIPAGRTAYGLAVDPDGFIWLTNWTSGTVQKYAPDGTRILQVPTGGPSRDRGVAATDDGDIWVANSGGSSVSRLDTNGNFLAEIPVGREPTGIAVDAAGHVWASNRGSSTASRIDPSTNAVDLTVSLGSGAAPYNYSDMTGSTLSGAPDRGTWTVVNDAGEAGTEWALVDWTADLPVGSGISVLVATSEDGLTFGPDVEVSAGAPLPGVVGRYLRITVRLARSAGGESPIVFDISAARPGGDDSLGYFWELIDGDGPPIFLSSTTSPTPQFVAPDDGTYLFELSVTDAAGLTDTDRVTVAVGNADPVLEIEPGAAFAGGVTQINAAFTDAGWLDTHSATIDWGDGTTDEVTVSAQGSGWGTFFGSHVYESSGTYAVTVTLVDDDGGTAVASLADFDVDDPVAVWANSETAPRTLDWSGAAGTIEGRVHSNNELRFVGAAKTVIGPATYAAKLSADTDKHIFEPPVAQAPVEGFPIRFDVADYRPGGPVATAVGGAYNDMTASCVDGVWHESQAVLEPGVYYADCAIQLNGSNIGGAVTLAAEDWVKISGSRPAFEPFYDGLLAVSRWAGADAPAIDIATSDSKLLGVFFAEFGQISVSGADNRFFCGLLGDTVDLSGARLSLRGANCGRPDSTVSGPLLVPDLTLGLEADRADASPSETISYDLTITNDGALLVVPGLMGLENVDSLPATVTGFDFVIEYFSVADGAWLPLAAAADPSLQLVTSANDAQGVTYPSDDPVGATIGPDGLATWGFQALVDLTPEQTAELLDPTLVSGLRNRVTFGLDPAAVQVRRLFSFGSDFVDDVRQLSGDVTGTEVTFILPGSDPLALDTATSEGLATLTPGESVLVEADHEVPVPDPRSEVETDAGYLSRLLNLDGTSLTAAGFAVGTGGVGTLVAPQQIAVTVEHLPVVSISTLGPDEIPAGSVAEYQIAMVNLGSSEASPLTVSARADADPLGVTDAPPALGSGEVGAAGTSYFAPADSPGGPLTVRSEVVWSDPNGISYGPVGSDVDAVVLAPATLSATLTDELVGDVSGDGFASPGDTVRYTLTVDNDGGVPLTGVTATVDLDPNTSLVAGSAATTSGSATEATESVGFAFEPVADSATGTFDVVIDDPFPSGVTTIEVQGTVAADGFDPVLTDDPTRFGATDPTRTTVVVPQPALTAFLSGRLAFDRDGDGLPSAGDRLAYTLVIGSTGSLAVTGIEATVPLTAGVTLVDGSVTTTVGSVVGGADPSVAVGALDPIGGPITSAEIAFAVDIDSPLPAGVDRITLQGTVASNELAPLTTDDPNTFELDATVISIGPGGSGGGNGLPAPTVEGLSLEDGAIVTVPTDISATLTPPDGETVTGWTVSYRRADDGTLVELATGTAPALAASIDPTTLPNGTYFLVIRTESSNGGVGVFESSFVVDGRLKLGRYVTTFQDMAVGVAGFPLQVNRTYDSFDKTLGDFGVGWTLDVADFRVATNGPLGDQGWIMEGCGGGLVFATLCFSSERPHFVTVTWPDGLTEIFDLTPAEGSTFFPGLTTAEFTGRPNTTSTLEAVDASLFWSNGDLLGGAFGSGGVYDPRQFRLTDRFGTEYLLEVGTGLLEMRDRSGNTVTITDDGITSSFGPGISFVRDGLGRIERIVGPDGEEVVYGYDANGDLVSVFDQRLNETTLTYHPGGDHFLDQVLDPLMRPFTTFEYTDGRVSAVVDGEGNRIVITPDVGARTETVVDAEQRLTTVSTFDERGNLIADTRAFDGQTVTRTFEYDANDQPVRWTNELGDSWSVAYDDDQNVVSSTDASGDTTLIVYDEFGLPLSWTDPLGNVTSYEYDTRGNVVRITHPNGGVVVYTYDGSANMTSHTDAVGATTRWTYDAAGNVASRTDGLGNVWSYTYDGSGRVLSETDPLGSTISFAYNERGQLTSRTDAVGNTWSWSYDALGLLDSASDPVGNTTSYTYDVAGRPAVVTDPLGSEYSYVHDSNGRIVTINDWAGEEWAFAYDGAGGLIAETDPLGRTWSYTYDAADHLASVTNPAGGVTTYTYTPEGLPASVLDPAGLLQEFSYDGANRTIQSADSLGRVRGYRYDAVGNLVSVEEPDGTVTSYGYDLARRMIAVTDAAGATITYGYDEAWNRVAVTDPLGLITSYGYDAARRLTTVTDPLGGVTVNGYDAAGRLVESTSASGITSVFDLDPRGLVTAVTDPLGNTSRFEYDAKSRRTAEVDANGNRTTIGYDPNSRMVALTDALGGTVSLGYDGAGQLTSLTDPNGSTWTATWGLLGGIVSETDPLGNTSLISYDNYGRLVASTDSRGVATSYDHDIAGRLVTYSNPDETVSFVYDALDRLTAMTDPTGTTEWTYDTVGRTTSISAPQGEVTYTYDVAGRRTAMVQPEGAVDYTYDAIGRVSTIEDWSGATTSMTYDPDGRTTQIARPNGVMTGLEYDQAGRLIGVSHMSGANVLDDFSYTLDGNGNRVAVTSPVGGTETYALDALNRLTGVTYGNGSTVSYTYDAAGNRVSEAIPGGVTIPYAYDAASRLTQAGSIAYTYDAAGNRLSAGDVTYGWDAAGNLASISGPGGSVSFEYDGTGLRVAADDDGAVSGLVWDRLAGLPEVVSVGSAGFVHGNGSVLAEVSGASRSDLLTDGLGSVRHITDGAGSVSGSVSYDVYGSVRSASGVGSWFGFTGQPSDPEGHVFLRARDLDPVSGTFLSTDPVRPGADGTGGYNPYAYVAHNPTSSVDPSGMFTPGVGAVAATVGTVVAPAPPTTPVIPADTFGVPGPMRPFRPTPGTSPKTPTFVPRSEPGPARRGGGGGVLGEYAALVTISVSVAVSAYIVGQALDQAFTQLELGLQPAAPNPGRPRTPLPTRPETEVNVPVRTRQGCPDPLTYWSLVPTRAAQRTGQVDAYNYQLATTGLIEWEVYSVIDPFVRVWADGAAPLTDVFDAKHVGNPNRSPFIEENQNFAINTYIRPELEDQFFRYGLVINDPCTPLTNLTVFTNNSDAVPYLQGLMTGNFVPGQVVVTP